jgi:hypothetical protein
MSRGTFSLLVMPLFIFSVCARVNAQGPAGHRTAYEIAGAWLGVTPRGSVTTNSNTVNFLSDLGMSKLQSQIKFEFVIRPSDRKRIQINFVPYRFDGETMTQRSFRFGGVTYSSNERITSKASLNQIAGAFEYDFVQSPKLEVGVIGAITYMRVRAEADSPSAGQNKVERHIAFPLAGAAVRILPSSRLPWLALRTEGKGMSFGSYGRYIEGAGTVALKISPGVTIEAGYHIVDGDGHHGTRGAKFRFSGPLIGLRLHDSFFNQ